MRAGTVHLGIIDNTETWSKAVSEYLLQEKSFQLIFSYKNVEEFFLAESAGTPDVIYLLVSDVKDKVGQLIPHIKAKFPQTCFVIVYQEESAELIIELIKVGAVAFIDSKESLSSIKAAAITLKKGGVVISPFAARVIFDFIRKDQVFEGETSLTRRENEVLTCLKQGLMYKEIAQQLFISKETVNNHVKSIYRKLKVSNRSMLLSKIYVNSQAV